MTRGPAALSRFAWTAENGPIPFQREPYKFFQWLQGKWSGVDRRDRWYLIPPAWDGFEAMDHVERLAYAALQE